MVSLIALLAGFYWWFWQSLSGLALLGDGRPILPRSVAGTQRVQVGNRLAEGIEQSAIPFPPFGESTVLLYVLPLFLVLLLSTLCCSGRGCRPSTWSCTAWRTPRSIAPFTS